MTRYRWLLVLSTVLALALLVRGIILDRWLQIVFWGAFVVLNANSFRRGTPLGLLRPR
jgi:hypothetical protein